MISQQILQALGRAMPALGRLPEPMRRAVERGANPFVLPAGRTVFAVDSECPGFVVLLSGTVRITKPLPSGREILLYRVSPGETCVLTASCILGCHESPAQGTAETDVRGVYVPRPLFHQLVDQVPAFRDTIFRILGDRMVELMFLVEEVAVHRMDHRLARRLTEHAASSTDSVVHRTHRELADELGTSREIVSRLLESFEERGWVKLGRRRILVQSPAELGGLFHTRPE